MLPTDLDLERLNKSSNNTLVQHLGIEYIGITSDSISAKMPVDNRTIQPHGILHGGASVVLAETLGSVGSNLIVNPNTHYCVGLEINANHIKSVKSGYVTGTATIIHAGRKTHIWEIKINNELNQLVCVSRLTIAVLEK